MHTATELYLDEQNIARAKNIYRAINHPLRWQILALIHRRERVTVTEIYKTLQIEQSVASQHLSVLRKEGLVSTDRLHRHIFYSVNYTRIKQLHGISERLVTSEK